MRGSMTGKWETEKSRDRLCYEGSSRHVRSRSALGQIVATQELQRVVSRTMKYGRMVKDIPKHAEVG